MFLFYAARPHVWLGCLAGEEDGLVVRKRRAPLQDVPPAPTRSHTPRGRATTASWTHRDRHRVNDYFDDDVQLVYHNIHYHPWTHGHRRHNDHTTTAPVTFCVLPISTGAPFFRCPSRLRHHHHPTRASPNLLSLPLHSVTAQHRASPDLLSLPLHSVG